MGIKTTIGSQGCVSEDVGALDSSCVITAKQSVTAPQIFSFSNGINVSLVERFTVISPTSSVGMTASLPVISTANVGRQFTVLVGTGSVDKVLLSASNAIRPGAANTLTFSGSHATVEVMAVSSAIGSYWHITNTNNNL